ncbi:DUF4419 domain-containing protein [Streptomyces kaniharaensis]|uniref:DUF4419 domain-containing protein n=1 Tax=Streptomyces kaniharaensis TaxID=212423 RepID=UPI002DDCEDEF|nr:DUF4419 domain-containing protein [Streptomyces kaniharaensis]
MISLCGIPRVRLEGTADDWALLASRVGELAEWFEPLGPWFAQLRSVLKVVARTAAGRPVDEEFWRSLYKWRSESGGDYVSGWITAFFAHTQTPSGPQLRTGFDWRAQRFTENAFPSHVSKVPVDWLRPDGLFDPFGRCAAASPPARRPGPGPPAGSPRPRSPGGAGRTRRPSRCRARRPRRPWWTVERVREATGVESARLLSTDRELFAESAEGLIPLGRPAAVINFAGDCVFRAVGDETWYRGFLDPSTGDITSVLRLGRDLETALRVLTGG